MGMRIWGSQIVDGSIDRLVLFDEEEGGTGETLCKGLELWTGEKMIQG